MNQPKSFPTYPGVYIFRRGVTPLYVGKAANIKSRLASYFSRGGARPARIEKMLAEATSVRFIRRASEIEALILEAELIKRWRPKYNVMMRDDKSYFYVAITKEPYPRIIVTHQPFKDEVKFQDPRHRNTSARYIGPFTGGSELYTTLKLLRRIFPYCTCKGLHKRPCLNSQIGRCFGVCCLSGSAFAFKRTGRRAVEKRRTQYRRNVANITEILNGKKTRLTSTLRERMRVAVRRERYEEAAVLRDQVFGLEGVFDHQSVLATPAKRYPWPMIESSLQNLLKRTLPIHRIEGYDISNISGTEATGSMIVFTSGVIDKSQYRKFKIRTINGPNDAAMHQEVMRRRFSHPEWPWPDIIVIDGGKPQLNAVLKIVQERRSENPEFKTMLITALAKREEILFRENGRAIQLRRQEDRLLHLFQRIRDESHRFAKAYHHTLHEKRYRNDRG